MQEKMDQFFDGWKLVLKSALEPLRQTFSVFSNMWAGLLVIGVVFVLLLVFCILRSGSAFRRQLKNPRVLAICALMMALNIILGYFSINFSAYLRIGFGFVTQPVVAMLFGPLAACMTGIVQDMVSMLLNPTGAYLPAYTLSVGISGMFYGLILYQKPATFTRVLLAKMLVMLVGNILLNSIALAPTAGSGFIGILPARILKNILLLPIQAVVSYLILKLLQQRRIRERFQV